MAKPTEIKKMAALLDQEADSSEDMAKKVWELAEQLMSEREQWVVGVIHPTLNVGNAVGPYATKNQLLKDYKKRIVAYDEKSKAYVLQLFHPSKIEL